MTDKEAFIILIAQKGLLWSYDPSKVTLLPDEIIIEQTLVYADTPQIQTLFKLYDPKNIKKVWKQHILPDERHKKLNYFLARFFFNYRNPILVINRKYETQLEKLQRLVAKNA